ncbi:ParB N-terminal domain-containing protein [Telmatocola sphagniphila]|uniref:ParB N-terminal domain-containing protein n=1 Tax=Telmatocola sphagniphila TaxID=1123043 RepID=A0A8E6B865_9BACT|nr:ParB N-terminal domain-containing protein [Telmatocola sphagniphila]QVL32313.1 ParB N-terminal domain-containing protein [Telmatocola sphagniphila]
MKIVERLIASIKPYEKNPRINDGAIEAVAKSIQEFGFQQPIVVDTKGVIIVGHTRYRAALQLGLKKIPVHVAAGLTPAQVRAYRITDNQTSTLSSWDEEKLIVELMALQKLDFDLDLTGFSASQLADFFATEAKPGLTDPDDVPAPPDAAKTKPGQIWILGNHRLMCGDSSKPEDLDQLLAGEPIHLVHTDPPYNVKVEPRSNNAIAAGLSSFKATHHQGFDVSRNPGKAKGTTKKLRAKDRPLANDYVSDEAFDRLLQAWFGNFSRALQPGRCFYLWGGYVNCANYPGAIKSNGLYFSQAIIWVKDHPVLTRKDFMGDHEWCFYGWKQGRVTSSLDRITLAMSGQ